MTNVFATSLIFAGLALLAVLGSAFFAGAETAVVGLKGSRVSKLRRRGGAGAQSAKTLIRVLSQKESFLGSTLIGAIICNVAAAVFVYAALEPWFVNRWLAPMGAALLGSIHLMLFGQIVPKHFYRQFPLEMGLILAPSMNAALVVLSPLSRSFGRLSSVLVRLAGKTSPPRFSFVTREELKLLAPKTAAGDIALNATRMIHGVFDMRQKLVRDLMVPLGKVTTITAATPVSEILLFARGTGYSRFPLLDDRKLSEATSTDVGAQSLRPKAGTEASAPKQALALPSARGTLLGIVNIYDVLYTAAPAEAKVAKDFLRRPPVLGDTDPIDRALQRLRAARLPMAIVTDAQQQAVGIITVEDIVAQIVGKGSSVDL